MIRPLNKRYLYEGYIMLVSIGTWVNVMDKSYVWALICVAGLVVTVCEGMEVKNE